MRLRRRQPRGAECGRVSDNLRKLLLGLSYLLVYSTILPIENLKAIESLSAHEAMAAQLREAVDAGGKAALGMTKILLVEDSKFQRLATERALARAGYEVSTAADGEQAVQMARERIPDVILLDLLLPKVTGPEVLKALKNDPATMGIAVVVLSGMSQRNAERLQRDGAFAFLGKAELDLDKGTEALLDALAEIVRKLNLQVPPRRSAAQS